MEYPDSSMGDQLQRGRNATSMDFLYNTLKWNGLLQDDRLQSILV